MDFFQSDGALRLWKIGQVITSSKKTDLTARRNKIISKVEAPKE